MRLFREDIGRRRSLYRLAIARSDIRAAQGVARYAERNVRDLAELWIPLQEALVVAYARPFTANEPLGPIPDRWSKFEKGEHQELHKDLISMRNELVAHADASRRRVLIIPPRTQPPVPGIQPSDEATLSVHQKRRPPEIFASVRDLCDDLFSRLHVAVQAEVQLLFGDFPAVQPFDLLTGEEQGLDVTEAVVLSKESLQSPEEGTD